MIDISSEQTGPAAELSNFPMRIFTFDGLVCQSMEGLLQAFKFPHPLDQKRVCVLVGRMAKKLGDKKTWSGNRRKHCGGMA